MLITLFVLGAKLYAVKNVATHITNIVSPPATYDGRRIAMNGWDYDGDHCLELSDITSTIASDRDVVCEIAKGAAKVVGTCLGFPV